MDVLPFVEYLKFSNDTSNLFIVRTVSPLQITHYQRYNRVHPGPNLWFGLLHSRV